MGPTAGKILANGRFPVKLAVFDEYSHESWGAI